MDWEPHLRRWTSAGVLDEATAARIREFESGRAASPRLRWPMLVALSFGALLVAAGLGLFAAARWDTLSPLARMAVVIGTQLALHGIGARTASRYPLLSSTAHGIGTIALGAAIALAGQIFNMSEHWPTGILIWAIGAWAGFALLRDLPQLAAAALLTPAWIAAEGATRWWDSQLWVPAFLTTAAFAYLSARGPRDSASWRWLLSLLGDVMLIPCALIILAVSEPSRGSESWTLAFAMLPAILGFVFRGKQGWPVLVGAAWSVAQSLLLIHRFEIAAHVTAAIASVGLVAWGVQELRKDRVNLGIIGFAITVLFFYFGEVMDSLDRSLSLIVLGVLFLAGGWQLERLRRRLLRGIAGGGTV